MLYTISNLNYTFTCINLPNTIKFGQSLKISLRKRKFNMDESILSIPTRMCNLCEHPILWDEYTYKFIREGENVYSMVYHSHPGDTEYGQFHKCKTCKLKINPNSIEAIKILYNINDDTQCLDIIHKRNKSPFYRINHNSDDAYNAFQGKRNVCSILKQKWINSQVESYNINKNRFIDNYGYAAWKQYNTHNKDSMSEGFYKRTFGENWEEARNRRLEQIAQYAPDNGTTKDKIKYLNNKYKLFTIDDVKGYINDKLKSKGEISKLYKIESALCAEYITNSFCRLIRYTIEIFNIKNPQEFFGVSNILLKNRKEILIYFDKETAKTQYSYIATLDGYFFRSDAEFTFYLHIRNICDNIYVINVNKQYPNSTLYYDFLININGNIRYIEICGKSKSDSLEYYEKMQYKKLKFNSILIHTNNIAHFINDVKENKVQYNEYY